MVTRRVSNLRGAGAALFALALGSMALSGCSSEAPEPEPEATEIPEELQAAPEPQIGNPENIGTPLEDRVATLGLVNKRNNETREIEIRPGESLRFGNVIVRLATCERSAPWEERQLTGGFVQVFVNERVDSGDGTQWNRVHSGWLYKEMPSINVVEHPIYDVWMKDCAMSFPGEEGATERESAPAAAPAAAPEATSEPEAETEAETEA